ncbi:hypothetical protein V1477_014592 [Vespula maculifrons]
MQRVERKKDSIDSGKTTVVALSSHDLRAVSALALYYSRVCRQTAALGSNRKKLLKCCKLLVQCGHGIDDTIPT